MKILENTPFIENIYVGVPQMLGTAGAEEPMDREWRSSIFKQPVTGSVFLGKTNLAGDEQADMKHHGGPEKAVFAYPGEHYGYWQETLRGKEIRQGGMGENFSTVNLLEKDVAIGDVYEIGEAVIQVSQPRQPCWKPARRYRVKNLALLLQHSGRTGWYYRVLKEGIVEAGQKLKLAESPHPEWTIERCNQVMHLEKSDFKKAAELALVEALAVNWKETFHRRTKKGKAESIDRRVFGPNVEE